jgi:hypothetical protein
MAEGWDDGERLMVRTVKGWCFVKLKGCNVEEETVGWMLPKETSEKNCRSSQHETKSDLGDDVWDGFCRYGQKRVREEEEGTWNGGWASSEVKYNLNQSVETLRRPREGRNELCEEGERCRVNLEDRVPKIEFGRSSLRDRVWEIELRDVECCEGGRGEEGRRQNRRGFYSGGKRTYLECLDRRRFDWQ